MTGLLQRLAARGSGRPGQQNPQQLRAQVPPRFAPAEADPVVEAPVIDPITPDVDGTEPKPVLVPGPIEADQTVNFAPALLPRRVSAEANPDVKGVSPIRESHVVTPDPVTPESSAETAPDAAATYSGTRDQPVQTVPAADTVRSTLTAPQQMQSEGHATDMATRIETLVAERSEPVPEPVDGMGVDETKTWEPRDADQPAAIAEGSDPAGVPVPEQSTALWEPHPETEAPPPGLSIGRIDVIFEAPRVPPAPRRRPEPSRTRGFDGYENARLGRRR